MGKYPRVYVESDLIAAHLLSGQSQPSELHGLLCTQTCYTGFPQIAEIMSVSTSEDEHRQIMGVLAALRPLGFHPRYSKTLAKYLVEVRQPQYALSPQEQYRIALTAAIASESSLPIATRRFESIYSRLKIQLAIIG